MGHEQKNNLIESLLEKLSIDIATIDKDLHMRTLCPFQLYSVYILIFFTAQQQTVRDVFCDPTATL
jgi:hypothetical protein